MTEQPRTWKTLIRLFAKLVQHQAKLLAGESFLSETSELGLDFFSDKTIEQIQSLLDLNEKTAQIKAAFQQADECFASQCVNGDVLHQVIRSYPLSDIKQLEKLAASLPNTLDDTQLREALAQRFSENAHGKLDSDSVQIELAVERYLECLNKALSAHVGQIQETMYRKLDKLSEDHKGLHEDHEGLLEEIQNFRKLILDLPQQIAKSATGVPLDYSYRIQEFLYEYLGTGQTKIPFCGRADQFAALYQWLVDAKTPYALLVAPSGRGKSALLCRWVQDLRLTQPDQLEIIFIPVSVRFQTANSSVSLAILASRLAKVHGEELKIIQDPKGLAESYLSRNLPDNKQVLVVLDGLDEASDWKGEDFIFPTHPPEGIKIIVSARYLAGDADECGWLDRLEWLGKGLACSIYLPELEKQDIVEVLTFMGDPLSPLGRKEEVAHVLHVLTDGDPLLVRLYVDRLSDEGNAVNKLTLEDLNNIQPGYEGYFDTWWSDQRKLWHAEGKDPDEMEDQIQDLLDILTVAFGPLAYEDLIALKPKGSHWGNRNRLNRLLVMLSRFVRGDGVEQGFIFSHPRLQQYFRGKFTDPQELQKVQARFLLYGRQTLTALNNGILQPEDAPLYVVQYYGTHLVNTQVPSEDFYALISKGWLDAWYHRQGTYTGFLIDVERAWERAEQDGPTAIHTQVLAALCFSSVATLSSNIPDEVLFQCVKARVLTLDQAVEYARRKSRLDERVICLAKFLNLPLAPIKKSKLCQEALEVARWIEDAGGRSRALAEIAPKMPVEQQQSIISEALETARRIGNPWTRSRALMEIAPKMPVDQQQSISSEVLEAARRIVFSGDRSRVLTEIAPQLPGTQQESILSEALDVARSITNSWLRSLALAEIAQQLPLEQALTMAHKFEDAETRSYVLVKIAFRLPVDQQRFIFSEALEAAWSIEDVQSRSYVLAEIAPQLPGEQALEMARCIEDSLGRCRAMAEIALHFPEYEQQSILSEALEVARNIEDAEVRSSALAVIVPQLPVERALGVARSITVAEVRFRALAKITSKLQVEQQSILSEALEVAHRIEDAVSRSFILVKIAPKLALEQRQSILSSALDVARSIEDAGARSCALTEIASLLPLEQQQSIISEALEVARSITNPWDRSSALMEIAPQLPVGQALELLFDIEDFWLLSRALAEIASQFPEKQQTILSDALDLARRIKYLESRCRALAEISFHLPENEQQSILSEALEVARSIEDFEVRSHALASIAPLLSLEQQQSILSEALEVTQNIEDVEARSSILVEIASQLPAGQQQSILYEAVEMARKIEDVGDRSSALAKIVPLLPVNQQESILSEALELARSVEDAGFRSRALTKIVLVLSNQNLSEAWSILNEIQTIESFRKGLTGFINQWQELCSVINKQSTELFYEILYKFCDQKREDFLGLIQDLIPVIEEIGGKQALEQTAVAIQQVGEWWP